MSKAATRGVQVTLQDAATTGEGEELVVPPGFLAHTVYIIGNGAVGAGAIQLETADNPAYAGTWAPLGDPIVVPNASQTVVNFFGTFGAIRARVSTTVTGGTVTVKYQGD